MFVADFDNTHLPCRNKNKMAALMGSDSLIKLETAVIQIGDSSGGKVALKFEHVIS